MAVLFLSMSHHPLRLYFMHRVFDTCMNHTACMVNMTGMPRCGTILADCAADIVVGREGGRVG